MLPLSQPGHNPCACTSHGLGKVHSICYIDGPKQNWKEPSFPQLFPPRWQKHSQVLQRIAVPHLGQQPLEYFTTIVGWPLPDY
jgi:hypothetical protein